MEQKVGGAEIDDLFLAPMVLAADQDLYTTATRGHDGIARIPHIPLPLPGPDPSTRVVAHIALNGFDSHGEMVDLESLPAAPVRLVLADHGVVVVLTHDSTGSPVAPRSVVLGDNARADKRGAFPDDMRWINASVIESGRATFSYVPLGIEVFVEAFEEGRGARTHAPGPGRPGEQVTIDLDFGAPPPVLRGRVVDELGQALVNSEFKLEISATNRGGGGSRTEPLFTDAAGRFRVTVPIRGDAGLTGLFTLRPSRREPHAPTREDLASASVVLDARIHSGENDLGDVVMRAPRSLVSGFVVDDLGGPVPNALIDGFVYQPFGGEGFVWKNEPKIAGTSGADGSFTIEASPPAAPLRLRATRRGFVDAEIGDFPVGASDVWITLTRTSRISGRVLLADAELSKSLWAHAARSEDTRDQRELFLARERARVRPDGTFELLDVRPGKAGLAFSLDGRTLLPVLVENLELLPGEVCAEPRLQSIDLRGRVQLPAARPKQN